MKVNQFEFKKYESKGSCNVPDSNKLN